MVMRKKYLLSAALVNLVIAEIAALQSYQNFLASPIAAFSYPDFTFIVVMAIPILLMLKRGNPFGFTFFSILIILNMGFLLAKSEIFYAVLDAIHSLGFKSIAEYLYSVFSQYAGQSILQSLLTITWFFVLSQLIWVSAEKAEEFEERGLKAGKIIVFQWAYIFIISYLVYSAYPAILEIKIDYSYPPLFTGIAGVIAIITAAYMLSKS
jgi:hypothetical protein